jgi:hypothetical protein
MEDVPIMLRAVYKMRTRENIYQLSPALNSYSFTFNPSVM